jgi:hypothetical protein
VIEFESLPDDILDRLPTAAALLNEREEVIFAYLIGGLARGSRSPLSDVDIAVFLERGRDGADARLSLFEALTEVLGTSELDLLILNTAPISIVGRVLQNRRILVDRDPFFRHRYESLKRREFFDFAITEEAFFERTLQIMIETCADIAGHLISYGGMRAPKSYADAFTVLSENGVLTDALLDSLVGMVKFRNVVVHQYDEVDAEVVIAILQRSGSIPASTL